MWWCYTACLSPNCTKNSQNNGKCDHTISHQFFFLFSSLDFIDSVVHDWSTKGMSRTQDCQSILIFELLNSRNSISCIYYSVLLSVICEWVKNDFKLFFTEKWKASTAGSSWNACILCKKMISLRIVQTARFLCGPFSHQVIC